MTHDYTTWPWKPIPETTEERFKAGVCNMVAAMQSISSGFKVTVTYWGWCYTINVDPFDTLKHAKRSGFNGIFDTSDNAKEMIHTIFNQKLLTNG